MTMTQKLVLTLVTGALIGMPLVYAKEGNSMKGMAGRDTVLEQLNLSAEQKKSLEANKEAQMAEIEGLLTRMMQASEELNDALMDPKINMNKVNDLNNEVKSIQGRMADKRVSFMMDVRKTLTPEQFTKFIQVTGDLRKESMNHRSEQAE